MNIIAEHTYPNIGTFSEALDVAKEAIDKYGGIIPNEKAAEKLGYKIKDPRKISGPIYRRLGDLSLFGLFEKIRGGYKTNNLAEKALDPYDAVKAAEGKREAIRNIQIIEKAFTEWKGEIPAETAFPVKIERLIGGVSWKEAQNHAESLRKLFIECFPHLKTASENITAIGSEVGGENVENKPQIGNMTISAKSEGFGVTKTLPFSKKGLDALKNLIAFLETQIPEDIIIEIPLDEEQQN